MIRPSACAGARTRANSSSSVPSRSKAEPRKSRGSAVSASRQSPTSPRPPCTSSSERTSSDGLAAYLGAPGVTHEPHTIGSMAAHVVMPAIHRVFSNLKTRGLGVYHGLRPKHLKAYLDEFTFRFNRRRTRHAAFATLLGLGDTLRPIAYKMLISPGSTG